MALTTKNGVLVLKNMALTTKNGGMAIGGGKKIDENIDENIILIVDL